MSKTKHTPGPLRVGHDGDSLLIVRSGLVPVALVRDGFSRTGDEIEGTARLFAAAYTSYDKHCGERAVECAEGDLLGELLHACEETLREVECRFDGIDFEVIERRLSDVLSKGGTK